MIKYPCPFCKAGPFDTVWQVENHVRISGGEHGPKYTIPEGFKVAVPNVSGPPSTNVSESNVSQTPDPNVLKGLQNGDLTKVQKIASPVTKTVIKCPDCGSTKEDWISVNAEDSGYNLTEEMKEEYDFICTNCGELLKVRE